MHVSFGYLSHAKGNTQICASTHTLSSNLYSHAQIDNGSYKKPNIFRACASEARGLQFDKSDLVHIKIKGVVGAVKLV